MFRNALMLAAALSAAPPAGAAVLHVPADHATIQEAIDAAAAGDTVLVAPGTYPENLDFLGKAITVESEAGPEVTIVDGRRLGAVVTFHQGEGPASVLAGLTLRNGLANDEEGGCVAIGSASPTVTGNHVIGCESAIGGGGIGVQFSSALVRGNVVVGNRSRYLGGGGIAVTGAGSAQIVGNLVADNACDTDGGGIVLWAAGTPLVLGNVIRDNVTYAEGGGIATYNWADADVVQNAIVRNTARFGSGGGIAALVPSGNRGPLLVANTIAANHATQGSAVYASGFPASVLLVNDLLASPDATEAIFCDFTRSTIGPAFDHVLAYAEGGGAYAVCPDPTGTSGNLSAPPLFVDPAGDYRLSAASPAVDAGLDGAALLPDQDLSGGPRISGAAVDIGAWEYPGAGPGVSPGRVDFGTVNAGAAGTGTVTISNAGVSLVVVGETAVSPPFAVSGGTCGGPLAAGTSCAIEVSFQPMALGTSYGVLTPVVDGARVRFPVVLTGTGAAVDLAFSPAELRFEDVTVGRTSTPSTVTISNPSAAAIALDALTITGSSGAFAQTNDCPASLPAGGTCTATVACTPGAAQWYDAALVPTGPFIASQGVPLVCSGVPPITPSVGMSPPSATVRAGDEAVFFVALARAEWLAQALAITCRTDAPAATCTVDPPRLPAGVGSASARVVVRTAGGGPFASAPARGGAGAPAFGLALLALGAAPLAGRRARMLVALAALAGLSCLRTTERGRTSPGTYAIAVTVASEVDGTAQTVQSTLVVVSR